MLNPAVPHYKDAYRFFYSIDTLSSPFFLFADHRQYLRPSSFLLTGTVSIQPPLSALPEDYPTPQSIHPLFYFNLSTFVCFQLRLFF